jgi:hypothetical protein
LTEHRLDSRATFLPTDPEPLVDSAFACPICLWHATQFTLEDLSVRCACRPCDVTWSVALDRAQVAHLRALMCGRMFRWPAA